MTSSTTKATAPGASASELIARYVHEVVRRLPPKQRPDVGRELRSSLLDALEDRFGPEPTWVQAAVFLREHGPPRKIAASYRPADQYLIGPEWYPSFTQVLRIVGTVFAALLVAAFAVTIFLPGAVDVAGMLSALLGELVQWSLVTFAVVIAIFHLLQRTEKPPERAAESWDPEELPAVDESDLVGRGEAVLEVVLPAAFLVLLWAFRDRIGLPLVAGEPPLLSGVLRAHLPWLSAAILLDMAHGAVLVWRGRRSGVSRAAKLAIDLFGLVVFWRIAAAVAAERAALIAAGLPPAVVATIERIAWSVPAVIGLLILVGLGKLVVRALRRPAEAV